MQFMIRGLLLAIVLLAPMAASAKAKKVDDFHWTGVERIVAVGDLHGDWDQYMKVMQAAGLVDRKGKWSGGSTHLVQTGDIPDRGPDTRRIIDHLLKLAKEAKRKGGYVHMLIGNHEALNVVGDNRYVTAGEYEAFQTRNSERYREAQWEYHLSTLKERDPEGFKALDQNAFRAKWEKDYPLGWVEHRQAWGPGGDYGKLVMEHPVVVKVNDTLFLHGGLSAKYCKPSLAELTGQVHDKLASFDFQNPGIVLDEFGPLWYRGLANDDEIQRRAMVDAILERHGASRMVVGHSPTQGVVWPRFDGRVVLIDVGIAAHYGGHFGFLEIVGERAVAHYREGELVLPATNDARMAYLTDVVALDPSNRFLQSRLQKLQAADGNAAEGTPWREADTEEYSEEELAQREAWLSPDICR